MQGINQRSLGFSFSERTNQNSDALSTVNTESTKANSNQAKECFNQAINWLAKGSYTNAFSFFELSAAKGCADASFHLGQMYQHGVLVEPNSAKASELYAQAMKLDSEAHLDKDSDSPKRLDDYFLGCLLEEGYKYPEGTPKSHRNLIVCYQIASNAGNPRAPLAIASLMERGAIEGGVEFAIAYHELAEKQGKNLVNPDLPFLPVGRTFFDISH